MSGPQSGDTASSGAQSPLNKGRNETDAERLDIFNGLLLAPNLDAAFDRGFISVADDGSFLLSPQLTAGDRQALGLEISLRVALAPAHRKYLRFHREQIFRSPEIDPLLGRP